MVSVVIPTYNAGFFIQRLLQRLNEQTLLHQLIIIDSGSTDDTVDIISKDGKATLFEIPKHEFNHGATRNIGLALAKEDIVIFMTQDALPASPYAFEMLINALKSQKNIAMAYGRQLPYPTANILGRLARITNYPAHSIVKTRELIPNMGIKTCSCSNSFAAYFKEDLLAIGGFPSDTILGEDVSVGARFILQGKAIAYSAEAQVYHSHDYTLLEEFKRYFDIGAFHQQQHAILRNFSKAESEGIKYVMDEWKYLIKNGYAELLPSQLARTIAKYIGYRLGTWQVYIPSVLKRNFSMHKSFW